MTVVGLLGLVAFFSGKPLQLGTVMLLLPLVTAGLCLAARLQIARSEGTKAGAALARWGILLSLFVGLGYGAYYFAVYWAVRQQSVTFAREWLDLLRQGQVERALFRTMPPEKRVNVSEESPTLLEDVDRLIGGEGHGPDSMLKRFRQQSLVRLIAQGGDKTDCVSQGIQSWEAKAGGFEVTLTFQIATPECSFEALITVKGVEGKDFPGRQWQIDVNKTGANEQTIHLTPFGARAVAAGQEASQVMFLWQQRMDEGDKKEAFLLTLPEGQRGKARAVLDRTFRLSLLAGGLAGWAGTSDANLLERYRKFLEGNLVDVDRQRIAGDEAFRTRVVDSVRKVFAAGSDNSLTQLRPQPAPPGRTQEGDVVRFAFETRVTDVGAGFVGDAVVVVEGDARVLDEGDHPGQWRIARCKLLNASPPPVSSGPGGPGGRPDRRPPGGF